MRKLQRTFWGLNLIAILLFIAAVLPLKANADTRISGKFFDILYGCRNNTCIESEPMNLSFFLENKGTYDLEIVGVEIIDRINDSLIASYKYTGLPKVIYYSEAEGGVIIKSGKSATILMNTTVPEANMFSGSLFYVCVSNSIPTDDQVKKGKGIYENRNCYEDNFSITTFECGRNENCAEDHQCIGTKCQKIQCRACEYVYNHSCIRHECCSTSECKFGSACVNNRCVPLNCKYDYGIINETCVKLLCKENEMAANNSCVTLECAADEGYANHTCKKLECKYNQFIRNNACEELQCTEYEGYVNHRCIKLACTENQTISNNRCVHLECGLFTKPEQHNCVYDAEFIRIFVRESIIILIIAALILWNILEFKGVKKAEFAGKIGRKIISAFGWVAWPWKLTGTLIEKLKERFGR